MKNASRCKKYYTNSDVINLKFKNLTTRLRHELEFGIPSYKDGSLDIETSFVEIFNDILELQDLINSKEKPSSCCPPATPESLIESDDISEAVE